jgi:hypothetical protein
MEKWKFKDLIEDNNPPGTKEARRDKLNSDETYHYYLYLDGTGKRNLGRSGARGFIFL